MIKRSAFKPKNKQPATCPDCGASLPYLGAWCSNCGSRDTQKAPRKSLRPKPTEFDLWRRELKEQFYRAGFTVCEIKLPGCYHNKHLSWAHIDKRRHLTEYELYVMVALACIPCHNTVEDWGPKKMRPFIEAIIQRRGWLPKPPAGTAVTDHSVVAIQDNML